MPPELPPRLQRRDLRSNNVLVICCSVHLLLRCIVSSKQNLRVATVERRTHGSAEMFHLFSTIGKTSVAKKFALTSLTCKQELA